MARTFEKGLGRPAAAEKGQTGMYGITEIGAGPPVKGVPGKWVDRIMVWGDEALRDRILQLLAEHGIE
jgi:hypothetical protein